MTITENGIKIRTLEETTADNITSWSEKTGDVDVSPSSAAGELVAITSEIEARVDQDIADAYTQNTISGATGQFLDFLAELKNTRRKENIPTLVYCTITGTDGILVPAGTTLRCIDNDETFTTQVQVVTTTGDVYVTAESENIGVSCPAGSIEFDPPITGLTITNNRAGIVGFLEESDTSLRARIQAVGTGRTINLKEGLQQALLDTNGVSKVNILDNNTDSTVEGVPARHFAVVVQGGNPAEFAQVIFEFMGLGNPSYGTEKQNIISTTRQAYIIYYYRPVETLVEVEVSISTDPEFDADIGNAEIREAISNYINSLEIGEKCIIQKVENAALVDFVNSATVTLNGGSSTLIPDFFEIYYTNTDEVTIV